MDCKCKCAHEWLCVSILVTGQVVMATQLQKHLQNCSSCEMLSVCSVQDLSKGSWVAKPQSCTPVPLLFTHVFYLASTDFRYSCLQSIPPPLQLLFQLLSDHSIICEHHSPFIPDLIGQPAHHHCKQGQAQS